MGLLRHLLARLRALVHRDAIADEIREELEFHVEARREQFEREGLTPAEARREARGRFGNLVVHQDRGYDVRGGGLVETIWQDVRYALRLLRRQPGFTSVAALTLALGIGASTAIVSVIDAKLLRPLPYHDADRLVQVHFELPPVDGRRRTNAPTAADRERWPRSVFPQIGALSQLVFPRVVDAGDPQRVEMAEVSDGFFAMHGIAPLAGREFTRADVTPGAPQVAILGHGHWMRGFGGDPDAIGRSIRVEDDVATIVGVLPPGYFPDFGVFRAMQRDPGRRLHGVTYARLRDRLTVEDAERELTALLPPPNGDPRAPIGVSLTRLIDQATVSARSTLLMLTSAVGLVLLIACVNVAGLLLARGATRRAELGTRAAIGAGRWRLMRQLLTEGIVLSALGGTLGVGLAWLSLDALVANIPLSAPSRTSPIEPGLNLAVLAGSAIIAIGSTLAFGLWPAIRLSRAQPGATLARGDRRSGSGLTRRGGQALIAVEVALAVVLVAGAGLMLRSFARLTAVDLGFEPRGTLSMRVIPVEDEEGVRRQYFPELLRAVRRLPGVVSATVGDTLPLHSGASTTSVDTAAIKELHVDVTEVMGGFFDTLRMPIVRGRVVSDDDVASRRPVVVLNETAARQLFPDGDAIGRPLDIRIEGAAREVVGVVADSRREGPRTAGDADAYLPFSGGGITQLLGYAVVVRVAPGATGLVEALPETARSIGPRVVVEDVQSGESLYAASILRWRQRTVLLSLLGGLGLILVLVGVFGTTAYAVARRTREIGVRMVFGAKPSQVVRRVLGDSAVPVVIGTAIGLGGAALTTRVIQSFLFETDPVDLPTFAAVAAVLVAAGCFAAWVPARRAARVDPVTALRAE